MLEVRWWGVGSLRDLSKNILKQGVGKGKSCSEREGGWFTLSQYHLLAPYLSVRVKFTNQ